MTRTELWGEELGFSSQPTVPLTTTEHPRPTLTATRVPHLSEVCSEGLHRQCQGHDAQGGCECADEEHDRPTLTLAVVPDLEPDDGPGWWRAVPRPERRDVRLRAPSFGGWYDRLSRSPRVERASKAVAAVSAVVALGGLVLLVVPTLRPGAPDVVVVVRTATPSPEPTTARPYVAPPRQVAPRRVQPPRASVRPSRTASKVTPRPTRSKASQRPRATPKPPRPTVSKTTAPEEPPPTPAAAVG